MNANYHFYNLFNRELLSRFPQNTVALETYSLLKAASQVEITAELSSFEVNRDYDGLSPEVFRFQATHKDLLERTISYPKQPSLQDLAKIYSDCFLMSSKDNFVKLILTHGDNYLENARSLQSKASQACDEQLNQSIIISSTIAALIGCLLKNPFTSNNTFTILLLIIAIFMTLWNLAARAGIHF